MYYHAIWTTRLYICCTTLYTIGLLRKSVVMWSNMAASWKYFSPHCHTVYGVVLHFIPCDLIFLLSPLMYGLVCSDSVIIQDFRISHFHYRFLIITISPIFLVTFPIVSSDMSNMPKSLICMKDLPISVKHNRSWKHTLWKTNFWRTKISEKSLSNTIDFNMNFFP